MKSPSFRCLLFVLLGLHFSTSANGSCDYGPYNGYWQSDELELQIRVTCLTSDSGITYPAYTIWSSKDDTPLQIYDDGDHLRLIFKDANVIIHRPDKHYHLTVDRKPDDEMPWQRYTLSLPVFESEETTCPIACLRPSPLCLASAFDGYWSTDDTASETLVVNIRSACGTYASGADFFFITVAVSKGELTLPVSSASVNGDQLEVNLPDSRLVVHLPKDNQIVIDSQAYDETQWQRTTLRKQEKP